MWGCLAGELQAGHVEILPARSSMASLIFNQVILAPPTAEHGTDVFTSA